MTILTQNPADAYGVSAEQLSKNAKRTRWIGILSIVIGVLAILLPSIFTIGFEIIFGGLLLVGGILQVTNALNYRGNRDRWLPLTAGVLLAILGGLLLFNPYVGAATLTAIFAIVFFINGLIRIIYGFQTHGMRMTGFSFLNGILSILIAVLVLTTWPSSSTWLIGTLIGIDFLLLGFWLISFASLCEKASSGNQHDQSIH